ncbi:MAG: UDP-N-acetylmuramoyl-L-alanyl-D-glutamate--2,6-diaminopimelate ligase [Candidatus Tectomicrobia bacterium]|uniref:UDP-N-acetylmuramoyl-L-alanyl-D-glutamate--2, 6-diaminopimelate ligase n=1 Tax=Tectimicrobiota bacterium TaxID=2528274 RepID=A0A932I2F9_UNCTE|nr:UDP-N-acetylmuramoyl-L-alanyl-D-glutamate--2,6-diaminopimelate ligase [Candidatus Tectomicrobia bacterium]
MRVANSREALGRLCAAFHGFPSEKLLLIGVTGTDGKTTTTHLTAHVLRAGGRRTAVISSVGSEIDGGHYTTGNTTPPPPLLQRLLAEAAARGNEAVVMEVSSHSVVQHRLEGCRFRGGVLTNVAADHLELHASLKDYRAAKKRFFQHYVAAEGQDDPFQAINMDDAVGRSLRSLKGVRTHIYGLAPGCPVRAEEISSAKRRIQFRLVTPQGSVRVALALTGTYNVTNALAAASAGLACGVPLEGIREGLESFGGVPGRFAYVECGLPFDVVIDYAHTPQAVRTVAEEGRRLTAGRLIAVFSAPGGRWVQKRAEMGRLVGERADYAVVTTDNPGHEDPGDIAREIVRGLKRRAPAEGYAVELDRARAIEAALEAARPGDLVLLMGKGHEEYQIIGDRRVPFSERETVLRYAEHWKRRSLREAALKD